MLSLLQKRLRVGNDEKANIEFGNLVIIGDFGVPLFHVMTMILLKKSGKLMTEGLGLYRPLKVGLCTPKPMNESSSQIIADYHLETDEELKFDVVCEEVLPKFKMLILPNVYLSKP